MNRSALAFLLLAVVAVDTPAVANDTMSTLGAGGLVFIQTDEVKMDSEDLYVSPTEIRVKYEFTNATDHDISTVVAFPLPDITGDGDFMVSIPTEDPTNIFGFATTFEGEPVTATLHQYAFATNIDYTAHLADLGIPLAPYGHETIKAIDGLTEAQKLNLFKHGLVVPMTYSVPAAIRVLVPVDSAIDGAAKIVEGTRLVVVGGAIVDAEASARWPEAVLTPVADAEAALAALRDGTADAYVGETSSIEAQIDALQGKVVPLWDVNDEKTEYTPTWTLKSTYSWEAVFPAGKTVEVEHSYKPSVGGTVAVTFLAPPYESEDRAADYKAKYCTDDGFIRTVKKSLPDPNELYSAPYTESWISYIWSTGANWAGQIGRFHLTVDKGRPENLVSFCWDGKVTKTSPTTFEMEATDWWPPYNRELEILVLNWQDAVDEAAG